MFHTKALRLQATYDPGAVERERLDVLDHQRRARLVDTLDRETAKLLAAERRAVADPTPTNRRALRTARHRVDHFTAAASRAGLLRNRKDTSQ